MKPWISWSQQRKKGHQPGCACQTCEKIRDELRDLCAKGCSKVDPIEAKACGKCDSCQALRVILKAC